MIIDKDFIIAIGMEPQQAGPGYQMLLSEKEQLILIAMPPVDPGPVHWRFNTSHTMNWSEVTTVQELILWLLKAGVDWGRISKLQEIKKVLGLPLLGGLGF